MKTFVGFTSVVPTGLFDLTALRHPSSELLGYFHYAPTGLHLCDAFQWTIVSVAYCSSSRGLLRSNHVRVKSLEIRDMWSYQQDHNLLEEFGQTTIIIGANNSGKSNIFKAIRLICSNPKWYLAKTFVPPDHAEHQYPSDGPTSSPGLIIRVTLPEARVDEILADEFATLFAEHGEAQSVFANELNRGFELAADVEWSADAFTKQSLKIVGRAAAGAYPPAPGKRSIPAVVKAWQRFFPTLQKLVCKELVSSICFIPENRRVGDACFDGMNITKFLEQSRSSGDLKAREKKDVFRRIEGRFKQLLKDPILELDPVAGGGDANVGRHHQLLPLSKHGGGLPHLLRMAGEFSRNHNAIILLEEPELGLNPELQRELIQQITDDTSNQYIITTHSSVFMDAGLAESVYRIEYDDVRSKVHLCKTKGDLYTVLQLLGNRPSDILQANVIIWVEGITDQYFFERCFELKKAKIRKGIDYAFAYLDEPIHGTLSPTEDRVLNLRDFSSRVAVVCDSDKTSKNAKVDEDKERLERECEKHGGFFWLTAGYEIENYCPDDVLTRALRKYKNDESLPAIEIGQYERLKDVLGFYKGRKMKFFPRILREMRAEDLKRYDLDEKLDDLINYISSS